MLFAINDFHEKGLCQKSTKVSCTSKLNEWIVPRNLTVIPKPLTEIKVKKIQFGKKASDRPTENLYDPRAPQDRTLDTFAPQKLYSDLEELAPNSSFFLYHDLPKSCDNEAEYFDSIDSVDVALETSVNATFIAACERAWDIKLNT